jgi:hypothetical protein
LPAVKDQAARYLPGLPVSTAVRDGNSDTVEEAMLMNMISARVDRIVGVCFILFNPTGRRERALWIGRLEEHEEHNVNK